MVVKCTCFLCKMYDWGTNCTMDVFRLQIDNQILNFRAHASEHCSRFQTGFNFARWGHIHTANVHTHNNDHSCVKFDQM